MMIHSVLAKHDSGGQVWPEGGLVTVAETLKVGLQLGLRLQDGRQAVRVAAIETVVMNNLVRLLRTDRLAPVGAGEL